VLDVKKEQIEIKKISNSLIRIDQITSWPTI